MTERRGNRGSGRGTKGEEKPNKGEIEVKDRIEETKEENWIKGMTLKTKNRKRRITR